jgi:TP901 family phage tail tape measure protein
MAETITVVIKADDQASGVFKKIGGSLGGIGKVAAGAAVAGIAAVGVAAGAVAVKSAGAFIDFERSMNEVFTLLPGISEQAMGDMEKQVLNLSKEFAQLPEDVVPALYQSLSAGVPQDNVFEFLETATKASVGGVTDLETAVDGITSVINAYGTETISAGEASDIMFTAVKLGKTTMEEISSAVFQAAPLAAALGVSFEEVAGSVATLTKQGVPTTQAMTQIRSTMVALQKPNKDMVDLLDAAGFASGQAALDSADLATVLDQLRTASEESGISMETAFGRVEAVGAVLALTGDNAEGAAADLLAMTESAGATDAAFEQMQQGIGPIIDKIMAFKDAFLITIGDALSPFIEMLFSMVEGVLPAVEAFFTDRIVPALEGVAAFIQKIIDFEGDLRQFFTVFEDGSTFLDRLFESFGMSEEAANALAVQVVEIANKILDLKDKIVEMLTPVIEWIGQFVELKDILIAAGIVIGGVVLAAVIGIGIAIAKVVLIVGALVAAVAVLRNAWENDWGGIRTFLTDAWATMQPILQTLVAWLQENIPIAIQTLTDFWTNTLLPAINAVWAFIQDPLVPLFAALWELLSVAGGLAITALQGLWQNVLLPALETVWAFIADNVIPIIEDLWDIITNVLSPILAPIAARFDTVSESIGGITGAIKTVIGWINTLIDKLKNIELPDWLEPGSPTPFELGLRGISDALQEINTLRLPQFSGQVGSLQPAGISAGQQVAGATNNYYLNLTSGQSAGSVIQDFDLMQAVSRR